MNEAYSYLKAFRHPEVLHSISAKVPARVPHVELILTDICQQHCQFCAYRLEGYAANQLFDPKRMMTTEKALEIIRDCAEIGVKAIQFTGGGEPTLHPKFEEILLHTIAAGLNFSLVSNGVKIDEWKAAKIVKGSWVRISLDAATEETYVTIRRVHRNQWHSAIASVRMLREERDLLKTDCIIGVGFVVTPDNWHEIFEAAKLAKHLGADNFRISAQFSNEDEKLFAGFHKEAANLAAEAEKLSDETFTVFNRFSDRLDDLRLKAPEDALCGYQLFTTYIGADLNVYRCCGYAYNERGLVGSIKEQRLKDFWMSQDRINNQLDFDARGCERCQFRRQNSAIAYVTQEEKQIHEDFV